MIYIFDNSSLSRLKHFFPEVFVSIWTGLDDLVKQKHLISTREVWNELQRGTADKYVHDWLKARKEIFTTPDAKELQFVAQIFKSNIFKVCRGTATLERNPCCRSICNCLCQNTRRHSSY